uniref:Uncharacterized protein n=1 Tax=Cannabis sativa TaxID=3483 RepID=A0A803QPR8_CANSA
MSEVRVVVPVWGQGLGLVSNSKIRFEVEVRLLGSGRGQGLGFGAEVRHLGPGSGFGAEFEGSGLGSKSVSDGGCTEPSSICGEKSGRVTRFELGGSVAHNGLAPPTLTLTSSLGRSVDPTYSGHGEIMGFSSLSFTCMGLHYFHEHVRNHVINPFEPHGLQP